MKRAFHFYPCPHCGESMRSGTLTRHEPVCIRKPVVYERIRAVLVSDDSGHGITRDRYLKLCTADRSLPSLNTLVRRVSPYWDNILAFFKLSPPLPDARRSQCPHCGEFIAGGKMTEHQAHCQEHKATHRRKPKPKPAPVPVETAPVALVVAPIVESVTVPLPRITPTAPASKWAGTLGYDPTWKAPTGDTQWLIQVQPGERTCLACGDTFAAGGYCMRCGTRADGTRLSKDDMPPSVPTTAYLHPDEYMTVH